MNYLTFEEFKEGALDLNPELSDYKIQKMFNIVYGYKEEKEKNMITTTFEHGFTICKPTGLTTVDMPSHTHSLACTPCPASNTYKCKYSLSEPQKEEGNNPMSAYASATVAAGTTEVQDQRKYLTGRLDQVYREKRDPLEKTFGLIDDDAPVGPKEFADRLASGKYIVRGLDKDAENYRYWHWTDLIQWRDPARKADQDGFKAARDELKAKKQAILDIIKIDEPKAGLDAIQKLEAWEPTGAAN